MRSMGSSSMKRVGRLERRASWLVGAALVATFAFAASPERAEAQYGLDGLVVAGIVGGAALVGVPSLIFTVGDIVSFARGTPYARGWAVLETIIASLTIASGIVTIAIGANVDPNSVGFTVGMGFIPLAIGGFNLAHAIWSFATLGSDDPALETVRLTPFVAPHGDGVLAGVGGTF